MTRFFCIIIHHRLINTKCPSYHCKNDDVFFTISCGDIIIKYNNYKYFFDKINKKIIDEEYNNFIKKDLIDKMFKYEKNYFETIETFHNFIKLLLTIPQIWYRFIY